MNQFLEMDIFFAITTVAVILIGIAIVLILIRIWQILGHVQKISRDVSAESALLREDIAEFRDKVRYDGFKFRYLPVFIRRIMRTVKSKTDDVK